MTILIQQAAMGVIGLITGILCLVIFISMIKKNKVVLLVPFLQSEKFISDIKMLLAAVICGELSILFYTIFLLSNFSFLIIIAGIPGVIALLLGFFVMFRWARRFIL
jgi:hypothetical protein